MDKVKHWLGLPALILGALLALGTFLGWFGFSIRTPKHDVSRLESLAVEYHDAADSIHGTQEDLMYHLFEEKDKQTQMTETLLMRFCLRDSYEELVMQRLLNTCQDLGIHRSPDDVGVRAELADTTQN